MQVMVFGFKRPETLMTRYNREHTLLSTDGFPVLSTSSGVMRYSYKDLLSLTVLEQHF